ncbi:E3 ubiquitin-protein ligase RNF168 [Erinaceus europaeus]|uniref:E3 ubiquitin-protein ligase RNF168 n=1 Tax=Erinaceus europaeus TaxID=9365 RepID=A0A1S3WV32_ERIEU|nr:E3 ubiquitin-protein ligase RNF168 [Erinaceus europaeus]
MAVPGAVPVLSEWRCQICVDVFVEPVTLPCGHSLCGPCFRATVEKASLCCPFCRRRLSSWARRQARSNSLVDARLWGLVQQLYPREVARRAAGHEADAEEEEAADDCHPVRQLSEPGELRREYEAERSRVEAERRASAEEESRASAEYIQRLLAEEQEEGRRRAEERRRQVQEQLRQDEELAWSLSAHLNSLSDGSVSASPLNSSKCVPGTPKSQKKRKNKQANAGDIQNIQKYLSPKSQSASASQPEAVRGAGRTSMSAGSDRSDTNGEVAEGLCTLDPLRGLEAQDEAAETPDWRLEGEAGAAPSDHGTEPGAPTREGAAAATLRAEADGGGTLAARTRQAGAAAAVGAGGAESCLPLSGQISKRKSQESPLEADCDPGLSVKRARGPSREAAGGEEAAAGLAQLLRWETLLLERRAQEERDRLLALQLQREADGERTRPNRHKGSPDGYRLRAAPSPSAGLAAGRRKSSGDGGWGKRAGEPRARLPGGSKTDTQPSRALNGRVPGSAGSAGSAGGDRSAPGGDPSPRPRTSQNSIFQMFQRRAK